MKKATSRAGTSAFIRDEEHLERAFQPWRFFRQGIAFMQGELTISVGYRSRNW